MDKKRMALMIGGILFVSLVGTLSHFVYDWTGRQAVAGLFTPVNESTWEHMKLLFFPMLLFALLVPEKIKKEYPCLSSALAAGILAGFCLIPVLFYTYTGILGYHISFVDIAVFYISVVLAFTLACRLTGNCKAEKLKPFLYLLLGIISLLFFFFTFYPPDTALFRSPV